MSDKDTSGPAFPVKVENGSCHEIEAFGGEFVAPHSDRVYMGMTLRDYFAAKAMQGFISSGRFQGDLYCASESYVMADAMLKAREQ